MPKSTEDKVAELRAFLKKVHRPVFEIEPRAADTSALERLMALVLQGDDPLANAEKTVKALKRHYSNWNEVRVARSFDVRDVLLQKRVTQAPERAPLLQEYLRRVFGLQNHLELDWIYDATSERRDRLLDSLVITPSHSSAVLDLDAAEDGQAPVHPDLKRLFARLALVKVNPRDAQVQEILAPLTQGGDLYPNYVALRLLALLGCDPKHPKSRKGQLLKECWDARAGRATPEFEAALVELGLPKRPVEAPLKRAAGSPKKARVRKARAAGG